MRSTPPRIWHVAACLFAIAATIQVQAAEPTTAEKYIAGLRDRRFFQLATEFAEQQLNDSSLSAEQALGITIELSRTHAAWALHLPQAAREAHWQQAEAVLARFRQSHPAHDRLLLLDLQQALTGLARGELLRQEAEVGAATAAAFEPARDVLRGVIGALESLDELLAKAGGAAASWPADERLALRDHIRWQLARARKNQALCYPAGSADRVAALAAALEPLGGLLRELPPESSLYWPARLESAECHRLAEDYPSAGRELEAILAASAPPRITLRARGELAEVHLARQDFPAMLQVLQLGRAIGEVVSAEFDLVYLRCYLALWQRDLQAEKTHDAAAWLAKAEQVAKLMDATHGAYWQRRANRLLAAAARGGGGAAGNLDVLIRSADNLYVRQQYAEAIAAYAEAAQTAEGAGEGSTALELWKKAAAVRQMQSEYSLAAELLAAAAVRLNLTKGADGAHLSAILLAARATSADPANLAQYRALMAQHLEQWPASVTANQVRLWQGKLLEHQQDWAGAAAAYTGLTDVAAPQMPAAVEGAARVFARRIAAAAEPAKADALANEALSFFTNVAQAASQDLELVALFQAAVMQHVKFELQYKPQVDYPRVERALSEVIKTEELPEATRREALSLMIVAQAAQPTRRTEALRQLRSMGSSQPGELLALLDQLAQLGEGFSAASRQEISVLVLELCESLLQQDAQLSPAQRDQIQQRQATALVAAGRKQEALALLAQLTSRHEREASIQEAYAQLLIESDDRPSLTKALERWRWISQRSRPDTQQWWRAKYNVALAHYRLGDAEQASQVIRYAQATGAGKPEGELAVKMKALLQP